MCFIVVLLLFVEKKKKKKEVDMQELTCEPQPGEEICIIQPVSKTDLKILFSLWSPAILINPNNGVSLFPPDSNVCYLWPWLRNLC